MSLFCGLKYTVDAGVIFFPAWIIIFLVKWEVGGSVVYTSSQTYQSPLGFDQGSVLSVHFMVQSARIAQIMTGPIPAPERSGGGPTVHAFSSLCQIS